MTSNDNPPPTLNSSDKRILKLWAVILTVAGLGQVLRWLGVF